MVEGLPKLCKTHHVCPSCAKGKLSRSSFPEEASHRASHILELIHADLAGPLEVEALGGSKYFLLLVDDFSRMSWVYFLKRKSDALIHFNVWITQVENKASCKVSHL